MRRLSRCKWPLFVFFLLLFFSVGHFAGAVQKEDEILRARSIVAEGYELQGPDGTKFATLAKESDGAARLTFFDPKGRSRLEVGLNADGSSGLGFYDAEHVCRAAIGVTGRSGSPVIVLQDEKGDSAVRVAVPKGVGPQLHIGKQGHESIEIGVSIDGSASITMRDPKNKPRIKLLVTDTGPSIVLYDEQGKTRSLWIVSQDGSASLTLYDRQSRDRLSVQTDKDGKPSIRFFDLKRNAFKDLTVGLR